MTSEQTIAQRGGSLLRDILATEEPVDIRPIMAGFPTGVSIVTAFDRAGRPWGMTCTSLCSVSLSPPILLICLRCDSPTLDAVLSGGSFAVNLLHDQARPAAELFASGAPNRFDRIGWHTEGNTSGPHLIDSAHTIADCTVAGSRVVGDHTVITGQVGSAVQLRPQQPLLYGLRRYASWLDTVESLDQLDHQLDQIDKIDATVLLVSRRGVLRTLAMLADAPLRHNELARTTGMDNKSLARVLRQAQQDALVSRHVDTEKIPVQVLYHLTRRGEEMLAALEPLARWWDKYAEP